MNGVRPLDGVRVVEMGSLLTGPFCGQLLANFGAEVIMLELSGKGDPMREWGRHRKEGKTLLLPIMTRNKKSVTLNLREEEGQEALRGGRSRRGSANWRLPHAERRLAPERNAEQGQPDGAGVGREQQRGLR